MSEQLVGQGTTWHDGYKKGYLEGLEKAIQVIETNRQYVPMKVNDALAKCQRDIITTAGNLV
jgi:hypothetical protein